MAADPYRWDAVAGVYRTATGAVVDDRVQREALEAVVDTTRQRLLVLGQQRMDGRLDTLEWRIAVQNELRIGHTTAASIAHGGVAQMDPSTRGVVGARLRVQYDYLAQFAVQVPAEAFDARAMARLAMYADSARTTYQAIGRRDAAGRGAQEERNVLGGGASCEDCLAETGRAWVPLGELSLPGERQCVSNCRCTIQTRRAGAEE